MGEGIMAIAWKHCELVYGKPVDADNSAPTFTLNGTEYDLADFAATRHPQWGSERLHRAGVDGISFQTAETAVVYQLDEYGENSTIKAAYVTNEELATVTASV